MNTSTMKKDQAQQSTDRARDAAAGAADKVKDAASQAGHTLAGAAQNVKETATQAASAVGDKLRDAASHTGDALSSAASAAATAAREKAHDATAGVGSGMQSLADTVRGKGPESGMLGKANEAVADSLESAGKYIEDKNLSGMVDDLSGLIRNNPIPALLVGLGVGFLLGRALRS